MEKEKMPVSENGQAKKIIKAIMGMITEPKKGTRIIYIGQDNECAPDCSLSARQ